MGQDIAVETRGLTKIYMSGMTELHALDNVSLKVKKGDVVSIMGPSGSGKSTLMNLIGCLDRPSQGTIMLDGEDITSYNDNQLAEIRGKKIGFVFQTFNLISSMTAQKNVELPMIFRNIDKNSRAKRARFLLQNLDLEKWYSHYPSELSGGQQQRVAIARSLANNPPIILADEPTGNLDTNTGEKVMELLTSFSAEKKTILLVTHDSSLKKYADRVIILRDGKISAEQ
ncbi:MAG TPA: ABC transporter ATP-binding protein [Desulfobacterales bacterium]|nr:ABC transporter ATP-binding protein [Desulfobacterales bacterium]